MTLDTARPRITTKWEGDGTYESNYELYTVQTCI